MLAMLLFKSDVQVCMYKADSLRAFVVSVNNTFVFCFFFKWGLERHANGISNCDNSDVYEYFGNI